MPERGPKPTEDPVPLRIQPMLSQISPRIPKDHKDRICELHFQGGLRIIAYVTRAGRGAQVKLLTRSRDNVTEQFSEISDDLALQFGKKNIVLDGNIVCPNGHIGADAAQIRAKQTPQQMRINPIGPCFFVISDILYAQGKDLRKTPLLERKRALEKLLPEKSRHLMPVPYSESDHRAIRHIAKSLKVREVIYRRKSSIYKEGNRSHHWVRVKVK